MMRRDLPYCLLGGHGDVELAEPGLGVPGQAVVLLPHAPVVVVVVHDEQDPLRFSLPDTLLESSHNFLQCPYTNDVQKCLMDV